MLLLQNTWFEDCIINVILATPLSSHRPSREGNLITQQILEGTICESKHIDGLMPRSAAYKCVHYPLESPVFLPYINVGDEHRVRETNQLPPLRAFQVFSEMGLGGEALSGIFRLQPAALWVAYLLAVLNERGLPSDVHIYKSASPIERGSAYF